MNDWSIYNWDFQYNNPWLSKRYSGDIDYIFSEEEWNESPNYKDWIDFIDKYLTDGETQMINKRELTNTFASTVGLFNTIKDIPHIEEKYAIEKLADAIKDLNKNKKIVLAFEDNLEFLEREMERILDDKSLINGIDKKINSLTSIKNKLQNL